MTLSDPFADPLAQFNAWLSSNTTDVLNSSISDFDFPSVNITCKKTYALILLVLKESEFYVLTGMECVCCACA